MDGILESLEIYTDRTNDLLATKSRNKQARDVEAVEDSDDEDEEDEDPFYDSTEEQFEELDEDMQILIADVFELSACGTRTRPVQILNRGTGKFTHLNYTGFVKIVKKHDVRPCESASASS
jgi:SPX domain protein involved in polyphosphate accumulation